MIPAGSLLDGESLRSIKFRNNYNASVLAIRHRDDTLQGDLSAITIRAGDMLLINANRAELNDLLDKKAIILLSEFTDSTISYKKAIPALLIALAL